MYICVVVRGIGILCVRERCKNYSQILVFLFQLNFRVCVFSVTERRYVFKTNDKVHPFCVK